MRPSFAALLALLPAAALAASADDWHKRSIYQVVTDRFATPDGSSPTCDPSKRVYCGGTYAGLLSKLDYIQSMGFDAIWISPIAAQIDGPTEYGEPYHGYWPKDFTALNTKLGSEDELKKLVSTAHSKGMYVMVDVVVNHMAAVGTSPNFSEFKPFNQASQYHPQCFITDYNNQTMVEDCWVGDEKVALVDINTEDSGVVSTLNSWIKDVVTTYEFDGIRIDTFKHIRPDFWPEFVKSAGVFSLGEVLHDGVDYVKTYTEVADSVFDYPSWFKLTSGFQSTSGDLAQLASTTLASQKAYKNGLFMTGAFLENHDQARFGSLTNDQALVKNAMTWPFIHDGFPVTYYGQEQGYQGGHEPASREALWSSNYATDKPLVKHITALNKARKALIKANSAYLTTAMTFAQQSKSSLAISKPGVLALLTNVGSSGSNTWSVSSSEFKEGTELVDVLSCETTKAGSGGQVSMSSSKGEPRVLVDKAVFGDCGASSGGNGAMTKSVSVLGAMLVAGVCAMMA